MLIKNVRDPQSESFRDVVFDARTGRPVEPPEEVWIVRNSRQTHVRLTMAWGSSAVFFIKDLSEPGLAKAAAARDLKAALEAKWPGFETIRTFALAAIAEAHEHVEGRKARGRVVVTP